ncbi:hypothetical protein A7K94_0220435, partial [Modestobacter sp. VKM Ac-2676]
MPPRLDDRQQHVGDQRLDLSHRQRLAAERAVALPPQRLEHRPEQCDPLLRQLVPPGDLPGGDLTDDGRQRQHQRLLQAGAQVRVVPGGADEA